MKKIFVMLMIPIIALCMVGCGNKKETENNKYTFLFSVDGVWRITGRGIAITGRVEYGEIKVGDTIQLVGMDKETINAEIIEIEKFREKPDVAVEGENVALFLKGVEYEQICKGQIAVTPDTIKAAKKFDAEITVSTANNDGKPIEFKNGEQKQFYFRTVEIPGDLILDKNYIKLSDEEFVYSILSLCVETKKRFYSICGF